MDKEDRLKHAQDDDYVQLSKSERSPLPDAQNLGPVHPEEEMMVTVLVRRPSITSLLVKEGRLTTGRHLNQEEFASLYGAKEDDLKEVERFALGHNLLVKEVNSAAGTVLLTGKADDFSKAFAVQLHQYEHPDFTYRGRTGHVSIPKQLADRVEAVFGLDNRPQLNTHFQIFEEVDEKVRSQANRTSMSYTPPQVADLYNYPSSINASDQCIGIIELGGGYKQTDLQSYFSSIGVKEPNVTDVSVNGGSNQPTGNPNGADGEVMLDIEVAGAVAPGVNIAVYFAPNTDAGFLNAIKSAIHDTKHKPSVISISWGSAEKNWTKQAMQAMDRAFQDAAALGVTICCAAGDRGSADGVSDGLVHVDFPASSPHVLACGGTRLEGSNHTITREVVWDEGNNSSTGGGVSDIFDLPTWQKTANVPPSANPGGNKGRGVPDVAGDADPATGYKVLVDGRQTVIGGTSAVAPLWAGLIALFNQQLGKPVGFLNPRLYQLSDGNGALHDITQGHNDTSQISGAYQARSGWDACTGLGSPNGTELLNALQESGQS